MKYFLWTSYLPPPPLTLRTCCLFAHDTNITCRVYKQNKNDAATPPTNIALAFGLSPRLQARFTRKNASSKPKWIEGLDGKTKWLQLLSKMR
jgi:hypothetical protein